MSDHDQVDALARMMRNEAYPEFVHAPPPEWSLRAARRILAWLHDEPTTVRLQGNLDEADLAYGLTKRRLDAALAREQRLRAALEGLRAEVAADDEPYLSAEWLLDLIDARLAALDD